MCSIEPLLDRIATDQTLPALARDLLVLQGEEYARLQAQLEDVEARLLAWHRADRRSRCLTQIPGVGPIGASMLVMRHLTPIDTGRRGTSLLGWA